MQMAQEITSNLKNLRYYSDKITELAKKQFELDYARGQEIGINSGPGSIRYDCLACIMTACTLTGTYCDNIEANLQSAISQDKVLHIEEEVEQRELI